MIWHGATWSRLETACSMPEHSNSNTSLGSGSQIWLSDWVCYFSFKSLKNFCFLIQKSNRKFQCVHYGLWAKLFWVTEASKLYWGKATWPESLQHCNLLKYLGRKASKSPWHPGLFSLGPVLVDCGSFPCTSVPPTHTLREWIWQ